MSTSRFSACLVLALVCATSAHAYTGDFSTPAGPVSTGPINLEWGAFQSSPTPYITASIGGGFLTIAKEASPVGVASILWAIPSFTASGDFQMDVTVDVSGITPGTAPTGGVSINFGGGSSVQYGLNSASVNGGFYDFIDNVGVNNSAPGSSVMNLRVVRIGNSVSEYYGTTGGPLTMINSLTNNHLVGDATFFLSLNTGGVPTSDAASVAFSNFSVTAVPEPQTYALMLFGLAAVASVARRRQR